MSSVQNTFNSLHKAKQNKTSIMYKYGGPQFFFAEISTLF